jgi:hypothetical protein
MFLYLFNYTWSEKSGNHHEVGWLGSKPRTNALREGLMSSVSLSNTFDGPKEAIPWESLGNLQSSRGQEQRSTRISKRNTIFTNDSLET